MIEAFSGVIKVNPYLLSIDLFFILLFFIFWYKNYKKTGNNIDYWNYNFVMVFLIPILLFYPLSASDGNILSVGKSNVEFIEESIDKTFLICILGITFVYIGRWQFYRSDGGLILRSPIIRNFHLFFEKSISIIINRNIFFYGIAFSYLFMELWLLLFIINNNLIGDPRFFFMTNRQWLPIYNFIFQNPIPFFIILRVVQKNKFYDKILLILILFIQLFFGARSPIFIIIIQWLLLHINYNKKGYIAFTKLFFIFLGSLVMIITLTLIRNDRFNVSWEDRLLFFVAEIAFGNTFSDLRDFAMILGQWDGVLLKGTSYISGFLSFIPSTFLPIRQEWAFGNFTLIVLGIEPSDLHPGARPGVFGEAYFNFGIWGVMFGGVILGWAYSLIDFSIKQFSKTKNSAKIGAAFFTSTLLGHFVISASMFKFYIAVFIMIFVYTLNLIFKEINK